MTRSPLTMIKGICLAALVVTTLATTSSSFAEEMKGKWRVEFHIGGVNPGDSIRSDAANVAVFLLPDGTTNQIADPRSDNLLTLESRISTETRFDLRVGYGLHAWKNSELILDVGIGYYESSVDNIEFSYLHDRQTTNRQFFQYEILRGGDLTMIPVSANLMVRFRPTKRMNPYIGGGVGYYFTEFTETAEWKRLAEQLDASVVTYAYEVNPGDSFWEVPPELLDTVDEIRTIPSIFTDSYNQTLDGRFFFTGHDLQRPRIETPDTPFLEMRGGIEWQWRPRISFFTDVRFTWAVDEIVITADGRQKFGYPLPTGVFDIEDLQDEELRPSLLPRPAYIGIGGTPDNLLGLDGPQPGQYYLNGGTLDYGGFAFSAGIRLTL